MDGGLLRDHDLHHIPTHNPISIDFGEVIEYKKSLLKKSIYKIFKHHQEKFAKDFNMFCQREQTMVRRFCIFYGQLKEAHGGIVGKIGDEGLVLRKEKILGRMEEKIRR